MLRKAHIIGKYIAIAILSLAMLSLFDSNPWWKVLFYSLLATALNLGLDHLLQRTNLAPGLIAILQGIAATLLAYLISLTPFFRTTFSTLLGFAVLFSIGEFLHLQYLLKKTNFRS